MQCTYKHLRRAEPTVQRLEHGVLGQRPGKMDQVATAVHRNGRPAAPAADGYIASGVGEGGGGGGGCRGSVRRPMVRLLLARFSLLLLRGRRRRRRRRDI